MLIVDSGSFTNVISKDLVYSLGLSRWRHPEPHYVGWLNNVGKLKITHKVCVSFSVGNYVDQVDCDVLPLEVCRLLLGRPCQYDRDATHARRDNTYTFVHDGKRHVQSPMVESAIKSEIVLAAKDKKASNITPKPKTLLLRGEVDDMALPTSTALDCVLNSQSEFI